MKEPWEQDADWWKGDSGVDFSKLNDQLGVGADEFYHRHVPRAHGDPVMGYRFADVRQDKFERLPWVAVGLLAVGGGILLGWVTGFITDRLFR